MLFKKKKKPLLFELKRMDGHGLGTQFSLMGNTIMEIRLARKKRVLCLKFLQSRTSSTIVKIMKCQQNTYFLKQTDFTKSKA